MNNRIFQEKAKVVYTREIAENTFETMLHSPEISNHSKPGQFINILPSLNWYSMMRRPMSIASQGDGEISIIYKVVGDGTRLMQSWGVGELVDIIGPLGNFWTEYRDYEPILIGGGVGIAPIMNLKKHLDNLDIDSHLIMGARTSDEHFLKHNPNRQVYMSTDDGSLGINGTVINVLESLGQSINNKKIFACGPPGMMEAVKTYSLNNNIICDLAIETIMACGVGICQGCTVELNQHCEDQNSYRQKYALACIDGPIFNARDIKTCYL
tara:strand:+ start:218 stop:1021 length:804 start_codon:yes stop_codon:yes gene_type:complete